MPTVQMTSDAAGYSLVPKERGRQEFPYTPTDYIDALEVALDELCARCSDARWLARGKSDLTGAVNAYYMTQRKGNAGVMRDLTVPISDTEAIEITGFAASERLPNNVTSLMERSKRHAEYKRNTVRGQ